MFIPPSDIGNNLRLSTHEQPSAPSPIAALREIKDALTDLVLGQRVMAEIKTQLPNGAYRALINQREITLALPFSAKSGDSLELEVVDTDGQLTLAVATGGGKPGAEPQSSATTTLSQAGTLIMDLMAKGKSGKAPDQGVLLNAQRPLLETAPSKGSDLAPQLKQAITQSGMFYESHQAQWLKGKLSTADLLSEPQGRQPPLTTPRPEAQAALAKLAAALTPSAGTATPTAAPQNAEAALSTLSMIPAADNETAEAAPSAPATTTSTGLSTQSNEASAPAQRAPGGQAGMAWLANNPASAEAQPLLSTLRPPPGSPLIAPDLAPLVQQQLESLGNQTFVWQGQAWPGQAMQWEIAEEERDPTQGEDETAPVWQTHMHLELPHLGNVEARLRLQGGGITVALQASTPDTETRLRQHATLLLEQLSESGLRPDGLSFSIASETHGHTE